MGVKIEEKEGKVLNIKALNRLQELTNELSEPLLICGDSKEDVQATISALIESDPTWQMISITDKDALNITEKNIDALIKIFKKGKFMIQNVSKVPKLMHKIAKESFPVCVISPIICKDYNKKIIIEGATARERYGFDAKPFTLDLMQLVDTSREDLPKSNKIIKDIYMEEDEFSNYFYHICDNMSMFRFRTNNEQLKSFLIEIANRIGDPVNYLNISKAMGLSNKPVKGWIEALIDMNILQSVPSITKNPKEKDNTLLSRAIKSEKLYFTNSNFAACLLDKESKDRLLENYAFEQIRKSLLYEGDVKYYHYADKDKKSIPLIIERNGKNRDLISYEFKQKINPESKKLFQFEKKATSRNLMFDASAVIYLGDRLLVNNDGKMQLFVPLNHI